MALSDRVLSRGAAVGYADVPWATDHRVFLMGVAAWRATTVSDAGFSHYLRDGSSLLPPHRANSIRNPLKQKRILH